MKLKSLVLGALIAASAVPASAVTVAYSFNGAGTDVASVTNNTNNAYFTLTVAGRSYSGVAPNALTSFTANSPTARDLSRNAFGLGVATGVANQMDTNSGARREAFLVTGSRAFYLTSLTLTQVDADDTLQIYGVRADDSLVNFTFGTGNKATNDPLTYTADRQAGTISLGTFFASNVRTAANGGTNVIGTGFGNGQSFTRFLITTRVGGNVSYLGTTGQGFALSALTAAVPEPATWAMLLVGFGLVGFARRRQVGAVAA